MTSVLYDVPGPRAILRNRVLAVVTSVAVAAAVGFVIYRLAVTGQFSAEKWELFTFPLVHENIIKATVTTLTAFGLAAVFSIALGLILSIGRLSAHAWIRTPVMLFTL